MIGRDAKCHLLIDPLKWTEAGRQDLHCFSPIKLTIFGHALSHQEMNSSKNVEMKKASPLTGDIWDIYCTLCLVVSLETLSRYIGTVYYVCYY